MHTDATCIDATCKDRYNVHRQVHTDAHTTCHIPPVGLRGRALSVCIEVRTGLEELVDGVEGGDA
eukprot:SAG11_NODE_38470_length_252_cov_0.679739_1_plen_64_part_10